MLAEFAIALPLLILLGLGLANVSVKIFQLGRDQLADYVLEDEARHVMERIVHQARAAKEISVTPVTADIDQIKIVFRAADDDPSDQIVNVAEVLETQYFTPHMQDGVCVNLNAKRQEWGSLSNPITGENSFGDTKINRLKYHRLGGNVLHVVLEMESLVTARTFRLATAVFMPGCDSFTIYGDT